MKILLTAGLGAATMFYLDPSRGRYRRAVTRARLEHGRDAVAHGAHVASHGMNKATHRARVLRRDAGHQADRIAHGARRFSHDLGEHAEQVAHGAHVASREVRHRAAGAAATLGSLFDRGRQGLADHLHGGTRTRKRLLLVPVTWIVTAGLGAAAVYYFDPSQGLYRRARLRGHVSRWYDKAKSAARIGRETVDDAAERARPGNGSGRPHEENEQPQPG